MELKEGMYVYSKERRYLGIGKVSYIDYTREKFEIVIKTDLEEWLANKEEVIASYNIIDLIEVGDVIEYEIKTSLETSGVLKGITNISDKDMLEYIKNDNNYTIKSILTHEQFESMSYKVGE